MSSFHERASAKQESAQAAMLATNVAEAIAWKTEGAFSRGKDFSKTWDKGWSKSGGPA